MSNTTINRAEMPKLFLPERIDITHEQKRVSQGGVPLYTLQFEQYDVVRVSLVFRAGTKYQHKPFLANSVLSNLSEGTTKRSAKEISDILDYYGLYLDVSIDRDYSVVTICSLSKFFDSAMDTLQDILLNPTFNKNEFDLFVAKRKSALKVERQKVDYLAREEFVKTLYGQSHPYGSSYSTDMYDQISCQDLIDFHKSHYLRSNMFVVVSGNFSEQHLQDIEAMCDKLPTQQFDIVKCVTTPLEVQSKHIEHSSQHQSALRIGRVMFDKLHPDFIPMQVVSTILGGYFGSRLIANLREEKGYTYSIFSAMINMEDSGYFVVTTEVGREYAQDSVEEIFKEMKRLQQELVPTEEIDMVKSVIIGEMLRILDGPFGIADVTIENIQNKTTNSHIEEMVEMIKSVSQQQIQQLAIKYLDPKDMNVIIVG